MDNTTFIGIFRVRDQSAHLAMPVQNNSGLWQAWRLPDGDLLIRPINENGIPWGSAGLMARQTFIDFLAPYRLPGDPGAGAPDPTRPPSLSSHSPDLLTLWYKQAGPAVPPENLPPLEFPRQGSGTAFSPDEANLNPAWEPDDMFFLDGMADDEPEPLYSAVAPAATVAAIERAEQSASFAETYSSLVNEPARPGPGPFGAFPPLPQTEESRPFWGAPSQEDDPVELERVVALPTPEPPQEDDPAETARIAALAEADMRKSFTELFALLDIDPAADRQLSLLLLSDLPFTQQQKFMFSEFGLALRRKQRHDMALTCHLRALRFAPDDEHILFNVARTEYELGNLERAVGYLDRALAYAPDFAVARSFQDFLRGSIKAG